MTNDWGCNGNEQMHQVDEEKAKEMLIAGESIANAKINSLILRNATINKISLHNCEIGELDLSGSTCIDTVIMQNCTIGKTKLSLQDRKEMILQTRFKQHVRIENCKFMGTFDCIQGQFEGEFSCTAYFTEDFLFKYNHFYQDIALNESVFAKNFKMLACNFDGHAWMRKLAVNGNTSFSRVIFSKKMNLGQSTFEDLVHINACIFHDRAGWNKVYAKQKVEFLKCALHGEFASQGSKYFTIFNMNKCDINGIVSLANTTFEKKFNLSKSFIRNQINTKNTLFNGGFFLDNVSCEGTLNFNNTVYHQDVFFRNSYFGGEDQQLNFAGTTFHKTINFEGSQLKSALINFHGACFHKVCFEQTTWGTQSSNIDFSKCTFQHNVKLKHATFVGQVNFNGSEFVNRVCFDKVIFHQTAFFRFCKFTGPCSFEEAQFVKQSYFVGCNFADVNFMNSEFEGAARFATETSISNCPEDQNATVFDGNANFSNARFNKKALFQQVQFAKQANFNNVYFGEQISFRSAKFAEDVVFSGAFCSLELDLRKINVTKELVLKGANINRRLNLAEASFDKISFYNMVTDVIAIVPHQIDGKLRGDKHADNPVDVERTSQEYLALKKSFAIQGMHDEEDWAYWKFRRNKRHHSSIKAKQNKNIFVLAKNTFEKIVIDYGSNYGTHPFRITFLAGFLIAAFGTFYWMFPDQLILEGDEITKGQHPTLSQCIYFSVMAFTTMGFGDVHPDFYGWLKAVVAFEALVGIITMTLFVGTYARKIVRQVKRMQKLAIIGSGISGIASAYYLRNDYDITIFEKENYLGGHTNTIAVKENGKEYNIDTGFIVYNEVTYPNLTKLFAELEVETQASNMSFGLYNLKTKLQFCGAGLPGIFAQHSNAIRFEYWRFILQIMRFFKTSVEDLKRSNMDLPLGLYLKKRRYTKYFIENYIVPMSSAIWSTPMEKMMEFPARTLIEFFRNHGLLGVDTHHPWRTVKDGSWSYIKKIREKVPQMKVHHNSPVQSICRDHNGVVVCTKHDKYKFDKVLLATHADQALKMLKDSSAQEKNILGCFQYQKNKAVLHYDESTMPPLRSIWSAWNYKILPKSPEHITTTTYYMNRLQNLKTTRNYFVSINEFMPIDPQKIVYETDYEHPLFCMEAVNAQKQLGELQQNGQVYFAGSYFGYGFHEDGLRSALNASEILKRNK